MVSQISGLLSASIDVKKSALADEALLRRTQDVVEVLTRAFQAGNKVLFCGNGGSAADAQHLAAEFSGRFYKDRTPLPAEALHVNTSYITAVANDYGYDVVYSRMIEGVGQKGDVLVSFSTSGNSVNILKAMEAARSRGMVNVAFTGASGGKMKDLADHLMNMPSTDTPRIQEGHITFGHIICQLVEEGLYPTS